MKAAAALQDANDEAQGVADAEAAMKAAAAQVRANTLAKVASAISAKRQEKSAAANGDEKAYIAGFKKKAEELGVDPAVLAKYIVERQAK